MSQIPLSKYVELTGAKSTPSNLETKLEAADRSEAEEEGSMPKAEEGASNEENGSRVVDHLTARLTVLAPQLSDNPHHRREEGLTMIMSILSLYRCLLLALDKMVAMMKPFITANMVAVVCTPTATAQWGSPSAVTCSDDTARSAN